MDGGRRGPGSLSLYGLLNDHAGEIHADLLRFYRVDTLDLFRGLISPKVVLSLVEQLPVDSATIAAIRGGVKYIGWDLNAYLLADVVDMLQWLQYTITVSNAGKNAKKVKKPTPYRRPGVTGSKTSNPFAAAFSEETGSLSKNSFQLPTEVLERSKKGPEMNQPFTVR